MTMSQKTESNQSRTVVKVTLIHFWFLANVPILHPLKTTKNVWCRMRPLARNRLSACQGLKYASEPQGCFFEKLPRDRHQISLLILYEFKRVN